MKPPLQVVQVLQAYCNTAIENDPGERGSQDKNFSLTGCGQTASPLQQWPQMMTGTLTSLAGSTHFLSLTTQANKSFPAKCLRRIKTQLDRRRRFTPGSLFQAAKAAE